MLYKVVLTFESVDEIIWCDHSNESYWTVLPCGTVYYAVEGGFNFWICGGNPIVWPFKWKLLSSSFLWYCFLCCLRVLRDLFSREESSEYRVLVCPYSLPVPSFSPFLCHLRYTTENKPPLQASSNSVLSNTKPCSTIAPVWNWHLNMISRPDDRVFLW